MDPEKALPEEHLAGPPSSTSTMDAEKTALASDLVEMARVPTVGGDPRIQFTETVRPTRSREDLTFFPPNRRSQSIGSIQRRPQSIVSIPPVTSKAQQKRRQKEKEEEQKHVDVTEHLMDHEKVAEMYHTNINMTRPEESVGLTSEQAAQLLIEHGPNNLTPPSKRHWILKFWDYLSSLFNLLLIFAGILEYILLGINFKDNFQNVSRRSIITIIQSLSFYLLPHVDIFGGYSHRRCIHKRRNRILPANEVAGTFRIIPQFDSTKVHVYSRLKADANTSSYFGTR